MKKFFAIVVYRCLVAGKPEQSLDVQVRYFKANAEEEVRIRLLSEKRDGYKNHMGETVDWEFRQIMAIEEVANLESGDEIVGFIAEVEELVRLA